MGISESKKKIVIDNYFKKECDVNTSIKEAFTKGFEVGLTKAVFPKDQYEARLKDDTVVILDKIRAEIERIIQEEIVVDNSGGEYERTILKLDPDDVLEILDKVESEEKQ